MFLKMTGKKPKIYFHGTDEKRAVFKESKDGKGYHVGAGPVEFLGPSFSTSKTVALSYGRNVVERRLEIKKLKKFRSPESLRKNIIKTFGLPSRKVNLPEWYREIAENFRIKLQSEGYDAVVFSEGGKNNPKSKHSEKDRNGFGEDLLVQKDGGRSPDRNYG